MPSNSPLPVIPNFVGFKSGKYTSEDKRAFTEAFIRFFLGDFDRTLFTKALAMPEPDLFGLNLSGDFDSFYETHFSSIQKQISFIGLCFDYPFSPLGLPEHSFCDVEMFLQRWLEEQHLFEKLCAKRNEIEKTQFRAHMDSLRALAESLSPRPLAS